MDIPVLVCVRVTLRYKIFCDGLNEKLKVLKL